MYEIAFLIFISGVIVPCKKNNDAFNVVGTFYTILNTQTVVSSCNPPPPPHVITAQLS